MKNFKNEEIRLEQFLDLKSRFEQVVVDLGCGDGRFVYKNALENPNTLYIGIDPAPKQMEEYVRKANRKKLTNVLFLVGSLENLPTELHNCANKVFIILPWGTLLKAVVHPTTETIEKLQSLLANNGHVEIIFGYNPELEPSETLRLELEHIDINGIKTQIIPAFEQHGFILDSIAILKKTELKKLESTWGKRISMQADRTLFKLVIKKTEAA